MITEDDVRNWISSNPDEGRVIICEFMLGFSAGTLIGTCGQSKDKVRQTLEIAISILPDSEAH